MHEACEVRRGQSLLVYLVSLEAAVLADGAHHSLGFDEVVGIIDGNGLVLACPRPLSEGVEGEHGLVDPEELDVLVPGGPARNAWCIWVKRSR